MSHDLNEAIKTHLHHKVILATREDDGSTHAILLCLDCAMTIYEWKKGES